MSRPFIFLDRDGTLIEDRHYAHRVQDCVLLPCALDALRLFRGAGFGLAIVTNQSGVGRGLFEMSDVERFHERLRSDLAVGGIELDGFYVCPHAPVEACTCRKPAPGLIERAVRELEADLASSWVIGDKTSDLELAEACGCKGALVLTGKGAEQPTPEDRILVARDLLEAARHIVDEKA